MSTSTCCLGAGVAKSEPRHDDDEKGRSAASVDAFTLAGAYRTMSDSRAGQAGLEAREMNTSVASAPRNFRGRLFLWLGLGLPVLGVVAYIAQLALGRLVVPWYLPALASLGVVLICMSLFEGRTVWRIVALPAVMLLGGRRVGHALCNAAAAVHGADFGRASFPGV